MRIQVRLFSRFRERLPSEARGSAAVDLPEGATLAGLLAHLGIADPVKLVTVNGQRATDLEHSLADGDTVHIFPPVVGG